MPYNGILVLEKSFLLWCILLPRYISWRPMQYIHSKPFKFKVGANCELSCIRGRIKSYSNHEIARTISMVGIHVTKAFHHCFDQKQIFCFPFPDLKNFANSWLTASNFKRFFSITRSILSHSRSEHGTFGNKIALPIKLPSDCQVIKLSRIYNLLYQAAKYLCWNRNSDERQGVCIR